MPLSGHSDFVGVVPATYEELQPSFDNLSISPFSEGNGISVLEVGAKAGLLFSPEN